MDVFLAGADSLKLVRRARSRADLVLEPAPNASLRRSSDPLDLRLLRLSLPDELQGFGPSAPLNLTFFSREGRSSSHSIKAHAALSSLPPDAFLEVRRASGRPWSPPGSPGVRLFAESAALALVRAEQELSRQVKRETLSPQAAFARLLSLATELCGTYARDGPDPAHGPCAFGVNPLAHTTELVLFLDQAQNIRGLRRARQAARLARDGAASPEEALLALAFSLPSRLGGVQFPDFVQNEPLEWPAEARGLVEHGRMRPDFLWPKHRVAVEYNGRVHINEASYREDQRRIRDYQLCGIAAFPVTYENVRDVHALERLLAALAHALGPHEPAGFARRVRETLADPQAHLARAVLLSQLLPAVPSPGAHS